LTSNNVLNLIHAQLLRGNFALGTLLGNEGFPSVPSQQIPAPGTGTDYFRGGYNIQYYTNSTMNVVQIECNYTGVRDNSVNRNDFADALSLVLVDYLKMHKNTVFSNCNFLSVGMNGAVITPRLYPNPVAKGEVVVSISGLTEKYTRYFIFNVLGQQVVTGNLENEKINLKHSLEKGIYVLELSNSATSVNFKVFAE